MGVQCAKCGRVVEADHVDADGVCVLDACQAAKQPAKPKADKGK